MYNVYNATVFSLCACVQGFALYIGNQDMIRKRLVD